MGINLFYDNANFVNSNNPFFIRGGNYNNGSNTGVFNFNNNNGNSNNNNNSFRMCLAIWYKIVRLYLFKDKYREHIPYKVYSFLYGKNINYKKYILVLAKFYFSFKNEYTFSF